MPRKTSSLGNAGTFIRDQWPLITHAQLHIWNKFYNSDAFPNFGKNASELASRGAYYQAAAVGYGEMTYMSRHKHQPGTGRCPIGTTAGMFRTQLPTQKVWVSRILSRSMQFGGQRIRTVARHLHIIPVRWVRRLCRWLKPTGHPSFAAITWKLFAYKARQSGRSGRLSIAIKEWYLRQTTRIRKLCPQHRKKKVIGLPVLPWV